jgi:hypothetical protein
MNGRLRGRIAAVALLLASASAAMAEDGFRDSNQYCSAPKPFREMAQDETRTTSEVCTQRDRSLRLDRDRELVAQEERPVAKTNLTMEQRHIIKEIVLKDLKPKKATTELSVGVGDAVPTGVEVQPFPSEISEKVPQVSSHGFFVKDEQVIIVSPKDNKITEVIE